MTSNVYLKLKFIKVMIMASALTACGGEDGQDGRDGQNGSIGISGNNGLNSLIEQRVLLVGSVECPSGGIALMSGLDLDNDGVLSSSEVLQTNSVCDGSATNVLDPALVAQGRDIFRFDTFGDEALWTDILRMHEVVESVVSPNIALSVGLKVDADVLPAGILDTVDLDDPATTTALLSLDAVVGLKGTVETVDGVERITSLGITCALCHSDVDDSVLPGIGSRIDGWPNRDINAGAIIALSPAMSDPNNQSILNSWGPGKYDAYWNQDGLNDPALITPAYGLNGIHLATYTGDGDISYWNAYVAVTQMGGQGNFRDDELGLNIEVARGEDQVTGKLQALREYQLSLLPPPAPKGSFDPVAAGRGKIVFEGAGTCSNCHSGAMFTDANSRLHTPEEVGTDGLLAMRAKTGMYRTTPLKGVWHRPPYFHNGSANTLADVVAHYNNHLDLRLTSQQQIDLEEYLKSL